MADELEIDQTVAIRAYKDFWKFIRTTVQSFEIHSLDEEQLVQFLEETRTSFNIPSIGKLYIYDKNAIRRKRQYINKLKEKSI